MMIREDEIFRIKKRCGITEASAMESKRKQSSLIVGTKAHLPFILGILLFLAVLIVCVLYIRWSVTPMAKYDMGPSSAPERWRFSLEDGAILTPEDGRLPLDGENTVVICETEIMEDVSDNPLLVVNAVSSDCVFFLDGQMVYSPSGRYADGQFSSSTYDRSGASGQFVLHLPEETARLAMIVQFQGNESRLSRMPKLTLYSDSVYYLSQTAASVAEDALPAGIYFSISLIIVGLFFVGFWKGKKDFGLILIALCSLSMAITYTSSFSLNAAVITQSPTITWFCTAFPMAAMGWMLWYRLRKKARLCILPFLTLGTGAMLFFLIAGFNNLSWVRQMNIMTAWVLPAMLLAVLIAAAWDALRGNAWFRRFFRYTAWAALPVALVYVFSLLMGGKLHETVAYALSQMTAADHNFLPLCTLLCKLLLILCFILAVLELIGSLARQDAEMQALALREKYAVENMEIMRQSQEETRKQRHELRHHILALEEMLSQDQYERAADYIRSLRESVSSLPSSTYSGNLVINAVAGHYLNLAKAEGVKVDADIKTESSIPMKDEDLCVLLTNILENALEACRAMKDQPDRFILLKISANSEHLALTCENSTDARTAILENDVLSSSKSDAQNHGYGIPAIRRIIEKHYGILKLSNHDGCFTVKVSI